jgi:beta-glucosidase
MPRLSKPAVSYRRRRDDTLLQLPEARTFTFPEEFTWGSATASHQVEGDNTKSDWWRFERRAGNVKGFNEFPEFGQRYKSDHWRRFPEDIRMMRSELGLSGYRFSLEWSRIEPVEGQFDQEAIARYVEMCGLMRENGIRPLVTLFHWSSPDWIWDHESEETSGWYEDRIVDRFARFCAEVVPKLAEHVDQFVTLNEPNIFLYGSYSEGILAPGHKRKDEELLPIHRRLLRCHVEAYKIIKDARPDAEVGIAQQLCPFESRSRWNPLEAWVAAKVEQGFSWSFLDSIHTGRLYFNTRSGKRYKEPVAGLEGTADFSGINFYERMLVRVPGGLKIHGAHVEHDHHSGKEIWPKQIHTRSFVDMLQRVHERYRLPIYITENGSANPDDTKRQQFLRAHLRALGHAIEDLGIDIRGYYYWSLLDNQEWADGFVPRLGLYDVNFADGERSLRESGKQYAEVIRRGSI